jgi:hypothetical protein
VAREQSKAPGELSSETQTRWDALKDSVVELSAAVLDPDGFTAAFAQLAQIGHGLDMTEILNAIHAPDDAGEHADALRRMLARIPDGWGRWISCSRGWYPLIVELDEHLAALFPEYQLEQVKEKYGGLRFYWSEGERITNQADLEPAIRAIGDNDAGAEKNTTQAEWKSARHAWHERLDAYLETDVGASRLAAFNRRFKLAEQLVEAAEQRAAVTCELCGRPGQSCRTRGPHPWYQTLCADCAQTRGYIPSGDAQ